MTIKNPFIEEYIEKNKEHLIKKNTKYLDDREFLKVYINADCVLSNLKHSTKIVFEYIFNTLQKSESYNQTIIDLNFRNYVVYCNHKNFEKVSRRSFYRAKDEMIDKKIIAKTNEVNIYFFNLNFFFNGKRLYVVNEYIKTNNIELLEQKPIVKQMLEKAVIDEWELIKQQAKNKRKSAFQS